MADEEQYYYLTQTGEQVQTILTDANTHIKSKDIHVTTTDKENWNSKISSVSWSEIEGDNPRDNENLAKIVVPTGGSTDQILGYNSSGTAKWINNFSFTLTEDNVLRIKQEE